MAHGYVPAKKKSLHKGTLEKAVEQLRLKKTKSLKFNTKAVITINELDCIYGLDITKGGDIYIVGETNPDKTPRVYVYDAKGSRKNTIHHPVFRAGAIKIMDGLHCIADNDSREVAIIDKNGNVIQILPLLSVSEKDYKILPLGLAADETGGLFITSWGTNATYYWNSSNPVTDPSTILDQYHGLCGPRHPAISTSNGDVIVPNCWGDNVTAYKATPDREKRFVYHTGKTSDPSGVCCDKMGHIYISECHNDTITVLSAGGEVILKETGIPKPRSIAVAPNGEFLAVVDSDNERVSVHTVSK